MKYYTIVSENGKLPINISNKIKEELETFKGKKIEISIDLLKSKRSQRQNRLWWLYMNILSNEIGYSKDEIHEICKFKFLKREKIDEKTGEVFYYLKSTTALNKTEFADLVTDLIKWGAETFNIRLPEPNEQLTI